eukprot:TRINITY_DN45074_c0_g1_i1.p1 TRINITY_DN45074_c0_g1~~TRINITY_DN45074_c0_g1_i1.p1  ORF type:complete len:725 (+),score=123.60 TRINITY_DN45074_c0_g1_i1:68-2176(+)
MAAVATMGNRRQSFGTDARVQFAEVANYVGQSMRRKSKPMLPVASKSVPSEIQTSSEQFDSSLGLLDTAVKPVAAEEPIVPQSVFDEPSPSPPLRAGRADRLSCQLEWLRAEYKAEQEQLRKMEKTLSDSMLLEKKAKKRAEADRGQFEYHKNKAVGMKAQLDQVRAELNDYTKVRTPQHGKASGRSPLWTESRPPGTSGSGFFRASDSGGQSNLSRGEMPPKSPSSRGHGHERHSRGSQGVRSCDLNGESCGETSDEGESSFRQSKIPEVEPLHARPARRIASAAMSRSAGSIASVLEVNPYEEEDDLSPLELTDLRRDRIREKLIERAGGAKAAFRQMDLNGSGKISQQDFADGVARLGVPWQEITRMKRQRDLFKLFDQDRDGVIVYAELFPVQAREDGQPKRVSTPEFWKIWCRRNTEVEFEGKRNAKWSPDGTQGELKVLFDARARVEEVTERRKWMSASFRRLKNKGKSDAKARECIAVHLPRGTGPRDRDGCATFSESDQMHCKKNYQDQVLEPIKSIQKVVYDMREQRRVLQGYRQQLNQVTMEPILRQRAEEERTKAAASFAGLNFLGKVKDGDFEAGAPAPVIIAHAKTTDELAAQFKMDEEEVDEIQYRYLQSADKNELLRKKEFAELLSVICQNRTLADADLEEWWLQAKTMAYTGETAAAEAANPKVRKHSCNFEQFFSWFADSELRSA